MFNYFLLIILTDLRIAKDLLNSNSNKIVIPDFKDNDKIIEEIIILEDEIQSEIQKINLNKEKETELIINGQINKIQILIKDKSYEEAKYIIFVILREIQNAYILSFI